MKRFGAISGLRARSTRIARELDDESIHLGVPTPANRAIPFDADHVRRGASPTTRSNRIEHVAQSKCVAFRSAFDIIYKF
jgi:hypothetical protein